MKNFLFAGVTIILTAVAAGGTVWGALGWHLDPIHGELAFLREHVLEIERRLTTVERDLSSVVGYLRGQSGLPRVMLMDGGCER